MDGRWIRRPFRLPTTAGCTGSAWSWDGERRSPCSTRRPRPRRSCVSNPGRREPAPDLLHGRKRELLVLEGAVEGPTLVALREDALRGLLERDRPLLQEMGLRGVPDLDLG